MNYKTRSKAWSGPPEGVWGGRISTSHWLESLEGPWNPSQPLPVGARGPRKPCTAEGPRWPGRWGWGGHCCQEGSCRLSRTPVGPNRPTALGPVATSLSWSEPTSHHQTVWVSPGIAFWPPSEITKHFPRACHKSMGLHAGIAPKPHDYITLSLNCLKKKSPS